jgi:hypothetical protein
VSQSEGFRPIKQVGVAYSIGFPLMVVGVFILITAYTVGGTFFWILGGGLLGVGIIAAASSRII